MKTVKLISAILSIALFAIAFTSCKKDSVPPKDNKTLLIGFWNITQLGIDDNKDGQVKQAEIFPVPTANGYFIQFFDDGTGNVNVGQPATMTWTIIDDNTVKLVYTDSNAALLHIKALTTSVLQMEDIREGSGEVDSFISCVKQTN